MKNKLILTSILCISALLSISWVEAWVHTRDGVGQITDETAVWDVLEALGENKLYKLDTTIAGVSATRGEELILQGVTTDLRGRKTSRQSKQFVCTSCHNTVKEFDDLNEDDPQVRLEYAVANDIPFLQATTFYGIVNRVTFYNDDYQKKYKGQERVQDARYDIRAAIRFCAEWYAQGRALEPWEVESILAYFWELQIRVGDLNLSEEELGNVQFAIDSGESRARAAYILQSKFDRISRAHFVAPMEYKTLKTKIAQDTNRIHNGKLIFEQSCLYCHGERGYASQRFEDDASTFKYLFKQLRKGSDRSVYHVTREGTDSKGGKRVFMPLYSKEKLSEQQVQDLRIYIEHRANQ